MTDRRFPPPWTVERLPGGFKVTDANGQSLAYFDDDHAAEFWGLNLRDFDHISSGLGPPMYDLSDLRQAIENRRASVGN
jgi:hypothetical protein